MIGNLRLHKHKHVVIRKEWAYWETNIVGPDQTLHITHGSLWYFSLMSIYRKLFCHSFCSVYHNVIANLWKQQIQDDNICSAISHLYADDVTICVVTLATHPAYIWFKNCTVKMDHAYNEHFLKSEINPILWRYNIGIDWEIKVSIWKCTTE